MTNQDPARQMLRVTLHEEDLRSLMEQFPKLSRTEISDVVMNHGPMRSDVERELDRISGHKR